jgi:hypothetical protein
MNRFISLALVSLFAAALPLQERVRAQEAQPASRQEMARTMFRELHQRMQSLQAQLASTDKEQSDILRAGNLFIQEARIPEHMDKVKKMLDESQWDESMDEMKVIRKDLTRLLELLQNRDSDLRKLMEEIARLEAFKNRVDKLIGEQDKERQDSAKAEELQKQLAALAKAKEQAERILKEQKDLRNETNQTGMAAAPNAAKDMADKEGRLKDDTDKLAKDLEKVEQKAAELSEPKADPKAGEAKPGEPKPGASKPGEPKPGEPKSGEPKPGEAKGCSSCAGSASQAMGQAQKKLGDNKPEPSLKDQDQAIEKLEQTMKEIEKMADEARRELEKLPFEQQAKAQDKTQVDTDTLSKDMEKSEKSENGQPPKQTPGRGNVQQAVPKQRAAAGQLKEYKPAKQKQQDAKEDLQKAKEQLEDALAQLRQQLQDEVLRALEERFGAMLHKQRDLSAKTKAVDKTRGNVLTADGHLPAALAENIAGIAGGEFDLGGEAAEALKLLDEEGSTAVFPEIVTELRDELYGVAKMIRGNATGAPVQKKQAEIEEILAMLINALRRTIEQREGAGQCNCNGMPPLVPISAELKMIRYLQEKVNKKTLDYETNIPVALRDTEDARDEAKGLRGKEDRVRDLTRKLATKLGKENQPAGDGR